MAEFIDKQEFLEEQRHLYCENCAKRKGMKRGKMQFVYEIGDAPCRSCGYGDVLDNLEDFPAADAIEELLSKLNHDDAQIQSLVEAAEERRWIPVTERLPEVGVWVLCYCRANSFDVFRMTDEGHWQYGNRSIYMKGYVTHWMPLPQPPKEEG